MASFTMTASQRYPVGTTVGAYLAGQRQDGLAPTGAAVTTAVVAADSSAVFSGLADNTKYVAYALVGGEHRYVNFSTLLGGRGVEWNGSQLTSDGLVLPVVSDSDLGVADGVATLDAASKLTVTQVPSRVRYSFRDDFTGSALSSAWAILRPDASGQRVQGGKLEIDTLQGALDAVTDTAKNVCLVPLPDGVPWVAETKANIPTLTAQGQQAGLIAYRDDQNFAIMQLARASGTNGWRRFLFERNQSPRSVLDSDYTQQDVTTLPTTVRFRLVSDGEQVTAYNSDDDGATWTQIGRPAPADVFDYVGLIAANGVGATVVTASFEWFTLEADPAAPVAPSIQERAPFGVTGQPTMTTPSDTLAVALRSVLRNTDKYTLNTWFSATYGGQGAATYLSLGGISETEVRPPASAAFALATSLATLAYDQTAAGGVTPASARATCIRLIRSVAKAHKANTPMGWGDPFGTPSNQSSLWAAYAGTAAWLLWPSLTATEQDQVRRMVVSEANRRSRMDPEFWKLPDGTFTTGRTWDSAAEENAWQAMILQLACVMMPTHRHYLRWMRKALALMVTANAIPADLYNTGTLHGQVIKDYVLGGGSNVNADGTIVNRVDDTVSPDYIAATVTQLGFAGLVFPLAGKPAPKASTHNVPLSYSAMTDLNFTDPPHDAPGGKIYVPASDVIYYPDGTDRGTSTRAHAMALDTMVAKFALDDAVGTTAAAWAQIHADAALAMQARDTTGQTYQGADSDNYAGREQWVAVHAALAWLAAWVVHNDMYRVSNAPAVELGRAGAGISVIVPAPPAQAAATTIRKGVLSLFGNSVALLGWNAAGSTVINASFTVPADYASGDLTFKVVRRLGTANGTAVMRYSVFRFRDATALTTVTSNANIDFTPADTKSYLTTITVAAANFQAGDVVRLDLTRLGDDAGDTATVICACDGISVEYTAYAD